MRSADQQRFVALVEAHKGILFKVANAYCQRPADRGDLAQEMIVQLWRAFPIQAHAARSSVCLASCAASSSDCAARLPRTPH
jgi:DNA-directed RNA polymerase specialized sigma24 family protein